MTPRFATTTALLTLTALTPLLPTPEAHAAAITWGNRFELESDADLDLSLPVVYALNAGDTTNNANILTQAAPASLLQITVGSKTVAFEGVEGVYGSEASFGDPTFQSFGDATTHLAGQPYNVTFSTTTSRNSLVQVSIDKQPTALAFEGRTYAKATGNAALDTLLNSQVFVDGRTVNYSALHISLNNLTAGVEYQVQLIAAADSRVGSNVPSVVTLNDALGNSVTGLSGYADVDNDGEFHVTSVLGRFTADGSSQIINAVLEARRNGGISGLIVTQVPEPASLALLSVGLLGMLRRSSRRN